MRGRLWWNISALGDVWKTNDLLAIGCTATDRHRIRKLGLATLERWAHLFIFFSSAIGWGEGYIFDGRSGVAG